MTYDLVFRGHIVYIDSLSFVSSEFHCILYLIALNNKCFNYSYSNVYLISSNVTCVLLNCLLKNIHCHARDSQTDASAGKAALIKVHANNPKHKAEAKSRNSHKSGDQQIGYQTMSRTHDSENKVKIKTRRIKQNTKAW